MTSPPEGGELVPPDALRLRPTARAYGAPGRGRCAPPTPRAAPPVRPSAHGPLLPAGQGEKFGARWVVPTERSDWGQHSSGKDCLRNLLPLKFIKKAVWQAKRVRP